MDADKIIKALRRYIHAYENENPYDIPGLAEEAAYCITAAQSRIAELESEGQGLRANRVVQEHIIKDGGSPLDKDTIVRLILENTALKAHNKEVMELLGKVVNGIPKNGCSQDCVHFYKSGGGCGMGIRWYMDCRENNWKHWTWQHADRYEELKSGGLKCTLTHL